MNSYQKPNSSLSIDRIICFKGSSLCLYCFSKQIKIFSYHILNRTDLCNSKINTCRPTKTWNRFGNAFSYFHGDSPLFSAVLCDHLYCILKNCKHNLHKSTIQRKSVSTKVPRFLYFSNVLVILKKKLEQSK